MLIWLFTLFLSGGYDRNATPGRIVRGMIWGTVVIAAVYGFLPEHLRFSRGMIIAGAAVNIALLIAARSALHLFRYGNMRFGEAPEKRILIVGDISEAERAQQLLNTLQLGNQLIGFAGTGKQQAHALMLGESSALAQLIQTYRINEVLFCGADIAATDIIDHMTTLGQYTDFKIIPPGSNSIIGSNSKNTAGDIYTVDVQLNIHQPQKQRGKRLIDIGIAILGILTCPLSIWFIESKGGFLGNCFRVLSSRATWVGYLTYEGRVAEDPALRLPRIPAGILHPLSGRHTGHIPPHIAQRVNFMYARDYSPNRDLTIIRNAWRKLGGVETDM